MTREDREFAKSRIKYLLLADNCLDKHDRESLEMAIKALDQAPKTGHWIDDNGGHGTSCSNCGKWYPHSYLTKKDIIYCCGCGAKMEGEKNE